MHLSLPTINAIKQQSNGLPNQYVHYHTPPSNTLFTVHTLGKCGSRQKRTSAVKKKEEKKHITRSTNLLSETAGFFHSSTFFRPDFYLMIFCSRQYAREKTHLTKTFKWQRRWERMNSREWNRKKKIVAFVFQTFLLCVRPNAAA